MWFTTRRLQQRRCINWKNVKFHFSARDARAMNPLSGELHHSLLVRNSSSLITHHHLLQFLLLHHYYYQQLDACEDATSHRGEAHKWFRRWLWKTLKNLLPNQWKNKGNVRAKKKISRWAFPIHTFLFLPLNWNNCYHYHVESQVQFSLETVKQSFMQ